MPNTARLRSWLLATALLWMAIVNGFLLWRSLIPMGQGYGDFANFYAAGTLVRRGQGTEVYNPSAQWRVQQEFSSEVTMRRSPMRYMRPPFEALLFSLFAIWPYAKALVLWTCLKLALLWTIPFIMVRGRVWRESFPPWATVPLILGTFPAFMDLLMGQDAMLLTFVFAICFRQLEKGKDVGAGVTLGLALVKFQLAVPFFFVLWIAGRKRISAGFAASASVLLVVSAAVVGWRGLAKYPYYLLALNQSKGVGIEPENHMTVRGLLSLFIGHVAHPALIQGFLALVAVAALVYTGLLWRKAGAGFLAEGFGLMAIVAIVTSYYASDYDLLLLIVPLLAMRTRPDPAPNMDRVTRYLEVAGLLLLLLTPLYWLTRVQLHAESLMTLPLLLLGIALARRLSQAGTEQTQMHVLHRYLSPSS